MFSYALFSSVVMETYREQPMAIKFCFKNELTAIKMFKMLQKVYGNKYVFFTNILKWYDKFRSGRKSVNDNLRAGRPRTSQTTEHIAKVLTARRGWAIRNTGIFPSAPVILAPASKN